MNEKYDIQLKDNKNNNLYPLAHKDSDGHIIGYLKVSLSATQSGNDYVYSVDKTYEEISKAYSEGKYVYLEDKTHSLTDLDSIAPLIGFNSGSANQFEFTRLGDSDYYRYIVSESDVVAERVEITSSDPTVTQTLVTDTNLYPVILANSGQTTTTTTTVNFSTGLKYNPSDGALKTTSSISPYVSSEVQNGPEIQLLSKSDGLHGLYATKTKIGGAYVKGSTWLVVRNADNETFLYGTADRSKYLNAEVSDLNQPVSTISDFTSYGVPGIELKLIGPNTTGCPDTVVAGSMPGDAPYSTPVLSGTDRGSVLRYYSNDYGNGQNELFIANGKKTGHNILGVRGLNSSSWGGWHYADLRRTIWEGSAPGNSDITLDVSDYSFLRIWVTLCSTCCSFDLDLTKTATRDFTDTAVTSSTKAYRGVGCFPVFSGTSRTSGNITSGSWYAYICEVEVPLAKNKVTIYNIGYPGAFSSNFKNRNGDNSSYAAEYYVYKIEGYL